MRYALEDVEMQGKLIRRGEPVTAWLGSANRDEEVFDDPYRFDVGRRPNHHIAFGFGPHFCIGAPLARSALQILFAEILRRVERIELIGPIEHLASNFTAGIKHMPIRMIPRMGI
jgi:cytochrome P450